LDLRACGIDAAGLAAAGYVAATLFGVDDQRAPDGRSVGILPPTSPPPGLVTFLVIWLAHG